VARIKEILKGHKKLILGFNHFIEKDYEITLHRAAPEEEEVKFMNKIKVKENFSCSNFYFY